MRYWAARFVRFWHCLFNVALLRPHCAVDHIYTDTTTGKVVARTVECTCGKVFYDSTVGWKELFDD